MRTKETVLDDQVIVLSLLIKIPFLFKTTNYWHHI